MKKTWKQTAKQQEAWKILNDRETTEVLFGGGAGGAKSFLGCAWLIIMCIEYPGTRWLMGRSKLKNLKETTLNTFFEICSMWGLVNMQDFKYNASDGVIRFSNGSEIMLKDLMLYPSDPNFDSLGSLEITGAFVDEANQITVKARNIVQSRIRYKLDEYNLIPKCLFSCNPAKNWVYMDFYKQDKEGTLPKHRKFVKALVTDNPFISPHYVENLKKLDIVSKERLLYGNWEYDDDPSKLFDYDVITDLFTNKVLDKSIEYPKKTVTADIARHGADKTVIMLWKELQVIDIIVIANSDITYVIEKLEEIERKEHIRRSMFIVDEDGVGGGVVDGFKGCRGFLNNGRPIKKNTEDDLKQWNYANLKTQCYFKLAELAKHGKLGISCSAEIRDAITEELEQIKQQHIDRDGRIALVPKEKIKELLGRSPDYADALMMRMLFEIKGNTLPIKPLKSPMITAGLMETEF